MDHHFYQRDLAYEQGKDHLKHCEPAPGGVLSEEKVFEENQVGAKVSACYGLGHYHENKH